MTSTNTTLQATPSRPVASGLRREARSETLRIVEYARFPRFSRDQRLQLGFTRDISASGMCLGVDREEEVGALLKLGIRSVDGRDAESVVARVVWSSATGDDRFWIGLQLVADSARLELAA
jgi:hypothetical protein